MTTLKLKKNLLGLATGLSLIAAPYSFAASWPQQPIRLVVPFPAGGNIDATGRIIAKGLGEQMKATVVVENKAGAAGLVGAQSVMRAKPDGYTALLASTGSLAAMRALDPNVPLDPAKDFVSAGPIAIAPMLLIVNNDLPARTLPEFLKYAHSKSGELTMGSAGTGTSNHLAGEMFQNLSQTKFLHVPYKGSGPAMTDLIGGQIDLMFDQMASSLPQVKSGKVRALAVTTNEKSALMPELPTIASAGLKDYEASTTTGILFPAGTPASVTKHVNDALRTILQNPSVRTQLEQLGTEAKPGTPEDFQHILQNETDKWTGVVKAAGITKNAQQ
ncbi:MAG: Bug family tripartite tricarboxylate transporter substrate binding protein [Advenella sp.]|jgi:tripartite-type tricarboxylate transporter receptor subunit TctC